MSALADREVLDLLSSRPDLLALADAVAETQPVRRRARRRFVPAALVAAAAIGIALIAPWASRGPNVVDRALAAVGSGPVVHALVEYSSHDDVLINIRTGDERVRVHQTEYWYDEDRKELHTRLITDGVQITEIVETPEHAWSDIGDFPTHGFSPQLDPALAGFVTGYRDALASGSAKVVGETTVDGRRAKLIDIQPQGRASVEQVAVDADTYKPLRFHSTYPEQRTGPEWRVVTIESVPRNPAYFAHPPQSPPRPTSGLVRVPRDTTLAEAEATLGRKPLWLGASFGGQSVDTVQISDAEAELTDGRKVDGSLVRIAYGDVRVSQAVDPAGAYALGMDDGGDPAPADGWIAANTPHGWPASRGHRPWQGELRVDGMWVLLDAPTRDELLAAARSLQPLN